ncbi:hypothetical protein JAAARDRAFT_83288, partial [Jaapia argillacea MUCL 33604]
LKVWLDHEKKSRHLLVSTINNLLLLKIQHKPSVTDMWSTTVKMYDEKNEMIVADTKLHMRNLKCPEDGSIHTHINQLLQFQKQLVNSGKTIKDKE